MLPVISSYHSPVMALTLYASSRDTLDEVFLKREEQDKGGNDRERRHCQRTTPVGDRTRVTDERTQRPRDRERIWSREVQQVVEKVVPRPQECEQRRRHQGGDRQRQDDAQEYADFAASVDDRRFLD